jgi:hypothetical protein
MPRAGPRPSKYGALAKPRPAGGVISTPPISIGYDNHSLVLHFSSIKLDGDRCGRQPQTESRFSIHISF